MNVIDANAAAYRIAFSADGQAQIAGRGGVATPDQRFYIGDKVIAHAFATRIPAYLADLVDVALAVYLADRLAPRRAPSADRYHLHWNRYLHLTLPVRDVRRWRDPLLQTRLRDVLALLTEDAWEFDFVPRSGQRRIAEMQGYLFPNRPQAPLSAALFSGGLDSLAGLCHQLAVRPDHSFVLFCGGTSQRSIGVQRTLASVLPIRLKRSITPVVVPFGLRQRGKRQYDGDERTQRSRAFAFQCLGAATAALAGGEELEIYEHGIGALNLPYTAAQLGTQSTRATDPRVLAAMGDFVSLAIDQPFAFRLPFFAFTKAELCASVRDASLVDLIRRTFSCDGFPQRVAGRPQCGLCTSCLLRRQALHAAELADHDARDSYVADVLAEEGRLTAAKSYPLRAMLDQVDTLRRALDESDPWSSLSRAYPQLLEVASCLAATGLTRADTERRIVDLYRRYCDEWRHFPVRRAGSIAAHAA
jgi:hypothetical protein